MTVRHLELRDVDLEGHDLAGLRGVAVHGLALSWVRQRGVPTGWVRLEGLRLDVDGLEPVDLALRARFALAEYLDVPTLVVSAPGLALRGRAVVAASGRAQAWLAGTVDLAELDRVVHAGEVLTGQAAVELALDSTASVPLTARVRADDLTAAGFAVSGVEGTLYLAVDGLEGELDRLGFAGGVVSGRYRLAHLGPPWPHAVEVHAEGVDLARLLAELSVPPASLTATVDAGVELAWDGTRIKAGHGRGDALIRARPGPLPASGRVALELRSPGLIQFSGDNLQIGGSTLSWQGPLNLGTWEPSWSVRAEPAVVEECLVLAEAWVGAALLPPGLTGVGALQVGLSGPWDRLRVGLRLDADHLAFDQVTVDRAVVEATIRESELAVDQARYQVGEGSGQVAGRVTWSGDEPRLELVTAGSGIPLARAAPWFGTTVAVAGEASFTGTLSGDVTALHGSWALALTDVATLGAVLGDGAASVELDGDRVAVRGLAFDSGLEGRLSYAIAAGSLAAEVHWPAMPLAATGTTATALLGPVADLDAAVTWDGDGLPAGWLGLTGDRFRLELSGDGSRLSAAAAMTGAVRVEATLAPDAAGGLSGRGDIVVSDVAALVAGLTPEGAVAGSGRAGLELAVTASGEPHLAVVVSALDLSVAGRDIYLLAPARVEAGAGGLRIDGVRLGSGAETVSGEVLVAADGTLTGGVVGSVDASLLRPFLPDWETAGHLTGRVALVGSTAAPRLEGVVEVDAGSFRLPGSRAVVSRITGTALLTPSEVAFSGVGFRFMNGEGSASGRVHLGDQVDLAVDGSVRGLTYDLLSGLEPRLSGSWRLTGPVDDLEIAADRAVDRAALRPRDDQREMILDWVDQTSMPSSPSSVDLDLHVVADRSLSARGPFLNLVGSAALDVVGNLGQPGVVGTLELEEGGDFTFQGVRYEIERCAVRFTDPTRVDPILDLRARAWVESYLITVHLSGTFDHLTPTVSSDPPLDQEGIFSLLALGHRNEAIGGGAVGVGLASALLTRQINQELDRRARLLLPVDQVRVDPFVESSTGNPAARMTVVKQVSPSWTIVVQSNLSSDRQEVVISRWSLGPGLFLEAIRDLDGTYGLDLKLRTRY